ncbi:MAG TPA: OsmC family protein [Rhodothermales bacterium]
MATKTIQIDARLVDRFTIQSDVKGHHVYIDQSKEGGGMNMGPSPLEYFFLSIAGCIVTIAKIVAHQRRIAIRAMDVHVEGDLDNDVLFGRRDDVRAGFQDIRIRVDLDADLTHEEKVAFLREVDRRCPISENVANATPVSIEVAERIKLGESATQEHVISA